MKIIYRLYRDALHVALVKNRAETNTCRVDLLIFCLFNYKTFALKCQICLCVVLCVKTSRMSLT